MMKRIRGNVKGMFWLFCVLFTSLLVYISYFTAIQRESLVASSYNRRLWEQEEKVMRGTIYDVKGRPLADTVIEGGVTKRVYPGGEAMGPVIGYSDRRLGRAGLENELNLELLGLSQKDPMLILRQRILGVEDKGNSVYLTLDLELQKTAYKAFWGRRGALAAIDPKTGAILALVSSPGYDPAKLQSQWDILVEHPDKPLVNRAVQGLYPPGSSFKVVTLAAALTRNFGIVDKIFYTPGYIKVNGRIIRDSEQLWPGDYDLTTAFRHSSNTVFIQVGQEAGRDAMIATSEAFGFNAAPDTDFPAAKSTFPPPPTIGGDVELAEDFIGQGKILATPLQMAKVTAIIANGGKSVIPYLIQKSVSPIGGVDVFHKIPLRTQTIEKKIADTIGALMADVVEKGTGQAAAIPGISVAGKTGSAENPHGKAHGWFIGFAPAEDPKIALAVIVENAGSGGSTAGPIAREVIAQYLTD